MDLTVAGHSGSQVSGPGGVAPVDDDEDITQVLDPTPSPASAPNVAFVSPSPSSQAPVRLAVDPNIPGLPRRWMTMHLRRRGCRRRPDGHHRSATAPARSSVPAGSGRAGHLSEAPAAVVPPAAYAPGFEPSVAPQAAAAEPFAAASTPPPAAFSAAPVQPPAAVVPPATSPAPAPFDASQPLLDGPEQDLAQVPAISAGGIER